MPTHSRSRCRSPRRSFRKNGIVATKIRISPLRQSQVALPRSSTSPSFWVLVVDGSAAFRQHPRVCFMFPFVTFPTIFFALRKQSTLPFRVFLLYYHVGYLGSSLCSCVVACTSVLGQNTRRAQQFFFLRIRCLGTVGMTWHMSMRAGRLGWVQSGTIMKCEIDCGANTTKSLAGGPTT